MKYRDGLLLILIIAEIALSLYSVHEANTGFTTCFSGFDCRAVQTSQYGSLFGIKLSVLGIFAFSLLLIVYLALKKGFIPKNFYLLSVSIGAAGSVYFIAVQALILKTFCSSCLVIDLTMIIIFAVSLYDYAKEPYSNSISKWNFWQRKFPQPPF